MDAADTIREAVARVAALRDDLVSQPGLRCATLAIKSFQAKRFSGTYSDLLASREYAGAARFFLEDLYSDKDYSMRDAQFARIAGALQKLFPKQVVATAVTMAQLHILTEELDRQMALAWMEDAGGFGDDAVARYIACWLQVRRRDDRRRQLDMVLQVGAELDRLTRVHGLRLMLRMMRRPAMAAGLGSLQTFLETGFDIFAKMSGDGERAREFLTTIEQRESGWIQRLSCSGETSCELDLRTCLSRATAPTE